MKSLLESLVRQMQDGGILYSEAVEEFRKAFISAMLEKERGNQSKTARALGMHRNTLSRTMAALSMAKQPHRAVPRPKADRRSA